MTVLTRTILTLALTVLPAAAFSQTGEKTGPVRAPDAVKGTTDAMLNPAFWISRIDNPDRVLMSPEDIAALNTKNADRPLPSDHPYAKSIMRTEAEGPTFNRHDPLSLGESYPGDGVRERLEANNARLRKGTFYDSWELPLTDGKKAEWIADADAASVPGTIQPRTAMIVRHTTARLFPTAEASYRMKGYLDDNSVTSLDTGMPAAVLHRSKTGDYLFVLTPIAWGWVPADDIAYAQPRAIRRYPGKDILVVTGHRVPCYADMEHVAHAGDLRLGERVEFADEAGDDYRVSVPTRNHNGDLEMRWAWVPKNAAVHVGFVPYTQRNVIDIAFGILGRPYGWHDSWGERDCGGIMRVIFSCFGFDLPRYWSYQQLCSDRATFVGDSNDADRKNAMLSAMPPGATLVGTTGHIGLYLGTVDEKPYGIHQCGWNYTDGDTEYKMARVVVTDFVNIGFNMDRMQFFTPLTP